MLIYDMNGQKNVGVNKFPFSIYVKTKDQEIDVKELISHFMDLPESVIRFYHKEEGQIDFPYPQNEEGVDELLQVIDLNMPIELYPRFTYPNKKIREELGLLYLPEKYRKRGMGYKAIEIRMNLTHLILLDKVCTMSQLPNFPKDCYVYDGIDKGYKDGEKFFLNLDRVLYNRFFGR
jgi:hypothetical protein